MVNQPLFVFSCLQSLLQSVQHQCRSHLRCYTSTHDTASINIDNERNLNEARPSSDIGKIGHPKLIWTHGRKVTFH